MCIELDRATDDDYAVTVARSAVNIGGVEEAVECRVELLREDDTSAQISSYRALAAQGAEEPTLVRPHVAELAERCTDDETFGPATVAIVVCGELPDPHVETIVAAVATRVGNEGLKANVLKNTRYVLLIAAFDHPEGVPVALVAALLSEGTDAVRIATDILAVVADDRADEILPYVDRLLDIFEQYLEGNTLLYGTGYDTRHVLASFSPLYAGGGRRAPFGGGGDTAVIGSCDTSDRRTRHRTLEGTGGVRTGRNQHSGCPAAFSGVP